MTLGEIEGAVDGVLVGVSDGNGVGSALGNELGKIVGNAVGISVGDFVGKEEGDTVGISVGTVDGSNVGKAVGTGVGVHTFKEQNPLIQSLLVSQFWPMAHPRHSSPPQSTPVSSPFCLRSKQDAAVGRAEGI
jgi:hypothetical protein